MRVTSAIAHRRGRRSRSRGCRPALSSRSTRSLLSSAPSSNTRLLLARDHTAPESTLALTKAVKPCCGRVRPLAWCPRPRSGAASLEAALALERCHSPDAPFVLARDVQAVRAGGCDDSGRPMHEEAELVAP